MDSNKKYCVIDEGNKFVKVLETDSANYNTVYAVPPFLRANGEAFWKNPGWSIKVNRSDQKNRIVLSEQKVTAIRNITELNVKNRKTTYVDFLIERLEKRIEQYDEMVILYYEKRKLPEQFTGYKKKLQDALSRVKENYLNFEFYFLYKGDQNQSFSETEEKENIKVMMENIITSNEQESIDSGLKVPPGVLDDIPEELEVKYTFDLITQKLFTDYTLDLKRMFPDLLEEELNYPLELNYFVDTVSDIIKEEEAAALNQ